MRAIEMDIIRGDTAPDHGCDVLDASRVAITEQATVTGLPVVDLLAVDQEGRMVALRLTGRHWLAVAGALRGINQRNHGVAEP